MKTKDELNALKTEYEQLSNKLSELTETELSEVTGGLIPILYSKYGREPQNAQRGENCANFMSNECESNGAAVCGTTRKDIGSDKNAKVIF